MIKLHRFDAIADEYVNFRRSLAGTKLYLDFLYGAIAEALGAAAGRGGTVLEIMSGQGDMGRLLEDMGMHVFALDISYGILAHNACETRIQGDTIRLPFSEGAFDGIAVCSGLHHLTEQTVHPALREIRRVLKPGGSLVFFEPVDNFTIARLLRVYFYKRLDFLGDRENEEIVFYRQDLAALLQTAGFSDISIRPFGSFGYAMLSQVDAATFLRPLARLEWLAKLLIGGERIWEKCPLLRHMAFGVVGRARK